MRGKSLAGTWTTLTLRLVAPADIGHAFAVRRFAFAVHGPIIHDSCLVG